MQDNYRKINVKELEDAVSAPVLQLEDVGSPLEIESIQLLRKGREHFVHVRSKDGAEGISVTNGHVRQLYPILISGLFHTLSGRTLAAWKSICLAYTGTGAITNFRGWRSGVL